MATAIYFRDTANLTSLRASARIIQQLADRGIAIEGRAIIALDEACRTRPRLEEKVVCDGGVILRKRWPHTPSSLRR